MVNNSPRKSAGPPKAVLIRIKRLKNARNSERDDPALSEAYRNLLRSYRRIVDGNGKPSATWKYPVAEALSFLGGQADRHTSTLADYDHRTYGPYLGVSDEGDAAADIRTAAYATPKAIALGGKAGPLTTGIALDAERLGSVGELPVGLDEYMQIWRECAGRLLMTTNVGSRVNLRLFNRSTVVTIPSGKDALAKAKAGLVAAFKPYVDAPGGPRPVIVYLEFEKKRPDSERRAILRSLAKAWGTGQIGLANIQQLGLNVQINWGAKGRDAVLRAIDLARDAGLRHVAVDGVVRKEADAELSLPGLLNYLPPEMVAPILRHAQDAGVDVHAINLPDADSVAREIWTSLNTARGMGWDLGKYGLFPLSLEDSETVISHVQRWFPDWCAAPVCYVDQSLLSRTRIYEGDELTEGVKVWLRMVARQKVRIVLIDTVDKSKGWKILKTDGDPKGILTVKQIAQLNEFAERLGVRIMWAGGITIDQAYEFGKLGVFGIYVTTAASEEARVTGEYKNDPNLAAVKRPTVHGVLSVKTALEGGYLTPRLEEIAPTIQADLAKAGVSPGALSKVLPRAWGAWWKAGGGAAK